MTDANDLVGESGRCHGPGCSEAAASHFCSETCWRAWHQGWTSKDHAATSVVEWQHPRQGRIREGVCGRHERELLVALTLLAIGCSGRFTSGEPCTRCVHEGERPRLWIDTVATGARFGGSLNRDTASGGSS